MNICWNNICLLSKYEEQVLSTKFHDEHKIQYFGMGREKGLFSYLEESPDEWDIVLSTDIDIFHDSSLISSMDESLHKFEYSTREIIHEDSLYANKSYLPFIVVPLVMTVNRGATNLKPSSLLDLCDSKYNGQFTFGGIHNSAGRSLLKSIWYLYGKDKMIDFLDNAIVQSMPAAAFRSSMLGNIPISIVPTIFAMRAGLNTLETVVPIEGAIAVPSFIAAKSSVPKEDLDSFIESVYMDTDFHKILFEKGKVVSPFIAESQMPLLYPNQEFINALDDQVFYDICDSYQTYG